MILTDINVILLDMPYGMDGYTESNSDGSYTIIINARLNREMQLKKYLHELYHIYNGDFEKENVNVIENLAHKCF